MLAPPRRERWKARLASGRQPGYLGAGHFQVTFSTDNYLKAKELCKSSVCLAAELRGVQRAGAGWEYCSEARGSAGSRGVGRGIRPTGYADLDLLSVCPLRLV